jgi:hypothetical protein
MAVRARLSDFGIVRLLDTEHMTRVDLTVGTASYLSPEQARGAEVGPSSDVYSLGLTLLEALTGHRAYDGDGQIATMLARLERPPLIPTTLPGQWSGLLAAMTALEPAQRPSAVEVARTLRDALTQSVPLGPVAAAVAPAIQEPVAGPMPVVAPMSVQEPVSAAGPHRSSHLIGILAAAVIVGLLVLGGFVLLGGGSDTPANSQPPGSGSSGSVTAPASGGGSTGPVEAKQTTHPSTSGTSSTSQGSSASTSQSTSRSASSSTSPSTSSSTSSAPSTSTSASPSTSASASHSPAAPPSTSTSTTPAAGGSSSVSGSLALANP